jgi:murein DD-endopeptidase MepM/ murein hydrolase activator NlpD
MQKLNGHITIVLVSEGVDLPRHVCVRTWASVGLLTSLIALLPLSVFAGCQTTLDRGKIASANGAYREVSGTLENLRDEAGIAYSAAREVYDSFGPARSLLSVQQAFPSEQLLLDEFWSRSNSRRPKGEVPEIARLKDAAEMITKTESAVVTAQKILSNHREVLSALPTVWPIKGGIGHVSQAFGLNPNPFSGQTYFHKGADISNYRTGDPVVASADGVVTTAYYDTSYGNNVVIKHKYGYFTRYGHMQSYRVRPGQTVKQGEIIGFVGNTGLSTGPHVHLEVWLGSELIDPFSFLATNKKSRPTPLVAPTGRD